VNSSSMLDEQTMTGDDYCEGKQDDIYTHLLNAVRSAGVQIPTPARTKDSKNDLMLVLTRPGRQEGARASPTPANVAF
jgi:hypothetical protein